MDIRKELPNSITHESIERDFLIDVNSKTPIAIIEFEGEIIHNLNPAATNLLGAKDPEEAIGKPVSFFIHPKYYLDIRKYIDNLNEGTHINEAKFRIIRLNEEKRDVELLVVHVTRKGNNTTYTIFMHDITYRLRHDFFDSTLSQIEQVIHTSVNNNEITEKAMKMAAIAAGSDSAAVALYNGSIWEIVHTYKFIPDIKGDVYTTADIPHAMLSLREKKIQLIGDTTTDPRVNNERLVNLGIMSVVVVPLYTKHKDLGAIFFNYYHPRIFEKEKEIFLSRLSTSLSLALENSVLFDDLNYELSERERNEKRLVKLNNILLTLSRSSQVMVSARGETKFIQEICSIIINETNDALVWVGFLENDEIVPKVWKGEAEEYYRSLNLRIRRNSEDVKGPAATAIETKRPVVTNINDPVFAPWRENAIKHGIASGLSLPLIHEDQVYGILAIYSKELDAFTSDEVLFLNEIAKYLSQGIISIRLNIAKKEAEEKLQKTAKELQELNATKDKFFSIIAHDMRNPFTSLIGASELLLEEIKEIHFESTLSLAEIINESANRGFALLQNLLEWSRTQTGTIPFKPETIELNDFIQKSIDAIMPSAVNKNLKINFHSSGDISLRADANMLSTVLRNIIGNAIKFTYSGGEINVSATREENYATVVVRDNGMGMSAENAEKLFRMDKQVSNLGTNNEKGSGLGLLLCKEFVERHGGQIWVQSTKGQGSKFFFTLPV